MSTLNLAAMRYAIQWTSGTRAFALYSDIPAIAQTLQTHLGDELAVKELAAHSQSLIGEDIFDATEACPAYVVDLRETKTMSQEALGLKLTLLHHLITQSPIGSNLVLIAVLDEHRKPSLANAMPPFADICHMVVILNQRDLPRTIDGGSKQAIGAKPFTDVSTLSIGGG